MNATDPIRADGIAAAPAATILPVERDPRWQAVLERDARAVGRFVYSVRTTGVYCRPGCPARRPDPRNVAFHDSPEAAEAAGFRPCRRCRPDMPGSRHAAAIAAACRMIDTAETRPSLDTLAAAAGMSPFHFHRVFKAQTGLTPAAYAAAARARRVRAHLAAREGSVTDALYAAGYGSSGRFYAEADAVLGMTPSTFRAGGVATEIRHATGIASLGHVLVAASARGVCAILLGDDAWALRAELAALFPKAVLVPGGPDFEALVDRVVAFVEQPASGLDLPLDLRGTLFQERVWQALRAIPPGETASYAEIARRLGIPRAVRAVARACATNRLAVAVPCHRAVRSDGGLAGYRWGIERKRALLAREAGQDDAEGGDTTPTR